MKVTIDGADHTSRELRKIHGRLGTSEQKWIFTQLLDDMYAIQRMHWAANYAGKTDKHVRKGNPPRYMYQSGELQRSITSRRGAYSFRIVEPTFALIALRGSAVGLAMAHQRRGREVIAAPSRRESRQLVETMGRFIMTGKGG